MKTHLVPFLALLAGASCSDSSETSSPQTSSATDSTAIRAESLLGDELFSLERTAEKQAELEANLAQAKADYDRAPSDLEAIIWYGRRLGYLERYDEAIAVYTKGLEEHPENLKLLRHRGHRHLSKREFDKAIADLSLAAERSWNVKDEIEPDGAPNSRNVPRSTLLFNIWYHLGVAYFASGDYPAAQSAFGTCVGHSQNDDLIVASTHWQYMATRRVGLDNDAAALLERISGDMDIYENEGYLDLLLFYKGGKTPEEVLNISDPLQLATRGFGVAHWYFVEGEREAAQDLWLAIVEGEYWPAFGHIAAEAELARL